MPSISQIIQGAIIFVVLLLLLWIAVYVFVAALAIGLCVAAYIFIRRWLIEKGILNAPKAPQEPGEPHVEIIEVDYHEVNHPDDKKIP